MSRIRAAFERRWQAGLCSPATVALVDWWLRHAPGPHAETLACCAGLLHLLEESGDVAVPLAAWHGHAMPVADDEGTAPDDGLLVPDADAVQAARGDPWLGDGTRPTALVLRDGLLLSWRHHQAEVQIAAAVRQSTPVAGRLGVTEAAATIASLFAHDDPLLPQAWQRVAVAAVVRNHQEGRRISLITGGPGTGKTTTVARLLAVLLMHGQIAPGRVAIVAPTGKAAERLAESLRRATAAPVPGARDDLAGCPPEVRAALPTTATTIHALLGANPASGALRYHAGRPLNADLVIIDEASMVDPVLLAAVLAAAPPPAHLVLVGDPHQLTSVESGCVLSDLCAVAGIPGGYDARTVAALAPLGLPLPTSPSAGELCGMGTTLAYNHRAGSRRPLVDLAQAILAGNSALALAAVARPPVTSLRLGTARQIADVIAGHAQEIRRSADPASAFACARSLQVLCALRRGPWGAQTIADAVDRDLCSNLRHDHWYHGRIIQITINDRVRGLMNGDLGLCWVTDGAMRVHFQRSSGLQSFATADLPGHEPAWALTIHKSQGSEYRHVHAVLPPSADHPLVMRDLLYTAVTRASDAVTVWGSPEVFTTAVRTPHGRRSGLVEECRSQAHVDPKPQG
jgi:exodeoxyribonuclease V alpha subunit